MLSKVLIFYATKARIVRASLVLFVASSNMLCNGDVGGKLADSCPALSVQIVALSGFVDASATEEERRSRQDALNSYLLKYISKCL